MVSPVFKPEELRQALMPTLEALYRQDPESLPFRQPVDPLLLGIPVSIFNCKHSYLNSQMTKTEPIQFSPVWSYNILVMLHRTTLI